MCVDDDSYVGYPKIHEFDCVILIELLVCLFEGGNRSTAKLWANPLEDEFSEIKK